MSRSVSVSGAREVDLVDLPDRDPGTGDVVVRVKRCGICGSDLHWYTGKQAAPAVCPGHEISGVIESVGTGAGRWREGDRVAIEPIRRCGVCNRCRDGQYHFCRSISIFGVTEHGGMSERLTVPHQTLFELPAAVDFGLGALAEPLAVAVHALRLVSPEERRSVLVLGAGTIGLLTVAAARHLGARFTAITARHEHQRTLGAALGADQVLAPDRLGDLGERPHTAIETVGGRATTIADGIRRVTRRGKVVMVGLFDETPAFDPVQLLWKEVSLIGSNIYNRPAGEPADFDIALEILADRADALRGVVTHTFALTDAKTAFDTAADKSTGAVKVLLEPGG